MPTPPSHSATSARLIFPALLGLVGGTALQLQQPELFAPQLYGYCLLAALVLSILAAIKKSIAMRWQTGLALAAFALLAFGVTGLRATAFLNETLAPELEGRDIAVTGM